MTRENDDGNEPYELGRGTCIKETKMAVYVEQQDGGLWIPKSVLHDDSEVFDSKENKGGKVVVKKWWARKNYNGR